MFQCKNKTCSCPDGQFADGATCRKGTCTIYVFLTSETEFVEFLAVIENFILLIG